MTEVPNVADDQGGTAHTQEQILNGLLPDEALVRALSSVIKPGTLHYLSLSRLSRLSSAETTADDVYMYGQLLCELVTELNESQDQ